MADRTQLPILPAAPRPQATFTLEYSNQLYRWLDGFSRLLTGVNYGRFSGLYLPGLPTTGYGLIEGEVFSNNGILTVVQVDDIWAGSLSATGEVGIVTVTT